MFKKTTFFFFLLNWTKAIFFSKYQTHIGRLLKYWTLKLYYIVFCSNHLQIITTMILSSFLIIAVFYWQNQFHLFYYSLIVFFYSYFSNKKIAYPFFILKTQIWAISFLIISCNDEKRIIILIILRKQSRIVDYLSSNIFH